MSLTDLARRVILPRAVQPASQGGPHSSRFTDYVRGRVEGDSEGYVDSTIATVAWQILRNTRAYQRLVKKLGGTPAIWRLGDFIVTPLTAGHTTRFILLALDPGLPPSFTATTSELKYDESDLSEAFDRWANRMRRQGGYGRLLVDACDPGIVAEFAQMQGLHLAVGSVPLEVRYTSERPTPPFDIQDAAGNRDVSMGVYSKSTKHGFGITTASHGVATGASYDVLDGGTQIDSAQVTAENAVLDSAFLGLSKAPAVAAPVGTKLLSGVTPNTQLSCQFHGATSGSATATVSGWVDDLLTVEPWLQTRVFTNQILQAGDSGSALIDANDYVIGFAFYTTTAAANPALSAWIWADNVSQDLQLT